MSASSRLTEPLGRDGDGPRVDPEPHLGGLVIRATPAGPIFAAVRPRRTIGPATLVPVLRPHERAIATVLFAGWLASMAAFWSWWLQPAHRVDWAGLVLNTLLLAYFTSLPGYFFLAVLRLHRVNPALPIPRLRVAFAVTRAPSEHWSMARTTLLAMLAQRFPYPYDVWLCDEDPDDQVLAWCTAHGVRVSCRRGVAEYHRATWPRRTRCKEGNFAYFYDHWGYREYDVVAQLDCDHVPRPDYLSAVVRPFADPAIGYVAAPSVCDSNADLSWSARGRLYAEATYHGPMQTGHNAGLAPLCVGSHYAVRTQALREIGGLGPELAEDFSTTFLLNSAGWGGAFAIDAEAHGDGPFTITDMVTQEFQWSRSLTRLLYDLVPHHLHRLRPAVRIRFGYLVAFYPLLALTVGTGLALPPLAVVSGVPWVNVNYLAFVAHIAGLAVWPLLLVVLLRRRGLLRPRRAPQLNWESLLFVLARWPYVGLGVLAATLRPSAVSFKVTPKSRTGLEVLPVRVVAPYLLIALGLAGMARLGELYTTGAGYVFLCLVGAAGYAVVSTAVPALHMVEAARAARDRSNRAGRRAVATAWLPLLLGLASLACCGLAGVAYPGYAMAALGW